MFQLLQSNRPAARDGRFETRVNCNAAQNCRIFQSYRQIQRESRCN